MFSGRITEDVHSIVRPFIKDGDYCLDLTVGNGHDTLFLAKAVGKSGQVVGLDIQELAIIETKKLLLEKKVSQVTLYLDNHSNVSRYIEKPISVAMMNLGYLPNSDKKVVTKKDSTLLAINETLKLLCIGGILSITVYIGHDGSLEEYEGVKKYLEDLDSGQFQVREIKYINRKNQPPIMYFVHKKKL